MKTTDQRQRRSRWAAIVTAALTAAILAGGLFGLNRSVRGQESTPPEAAEAESSVFSPARRTVGEAIRAFLGYRYRPEPEQPMPYYHDLHISEAGLTCDFCHDAVATGPSARIPSVQTCMTCHATIATDQPSIQMMTSYYERGEEIPWQRVYGWPSEAHVRFNHAPHIRAEVECATCHGDVASMTVAERVVDHSMAFCVDCHEQEQASNDCMTCHY